MRLDFPSSSVSDRLFRFQISFRLLSDSFQTGSMKNRKNFRFQIGSDWFRLVQIDFSDFRLDFHILDWLHIYLRLISDCCLFCFIKTSDFRLFQIDSYWLENESPWIFAELFPL